MQFPYGRDSRSAASLPGKYLKCAYGGRPTHAIDVQTAVVLEILERTLGGGPKDAVDATGIKSDSGQ